MLRGSGADATTIVATGTSRRTLLDVRPLQRAASPSSRARALVVTEDAPTGASVLTLADLAELAEGDRVVVTRPCTEAWIAALKMNTSSEKYANLRITWLRGSRELVWHRRIVSVNREKRQISLDAPITTALERRFGAGTVAKVAGDGPMTQVGIEELTLESAFDPAQPAMRTIPGSLWRSTRPRTHGCGT